MTESKCVCGAELEYVGAVEAGNEDVFYRVTCKQCGREGKEWYNTEYSETIMDDSDVDHAEGEEQDSMTRVTEN